MESASKAAMAIILLMLCAGMLVTSEGKADVKTPRRLMQTEPVVLLGVVENDVDIIAGGKPQNASVTEQVQVAAIASFTATGYCTTKDANGFLCWNPPTNLADKEYKYWDGKYWQVKQCTATLPCPCQTGAGTCGTSWSGKSGCYGYTMLPDGASCSTGRVYQGVGQCKAGYCTNEQTVPYQTFIFPK